MTDVPRFQLVRTAPDEAHRHYHGGRLVNVVLSVADLWKAHMQEMRGSRIIDLRPSFHWPRRHASLPHNRDGPA